ncbi:MAG: hypothetical protein U0103_15120 [Candidatus Obscuribacterales bacterium]
MTYTQSTESIDNVVKLLPRQFRHKTYVPLSNHVWVQRTPMFARLGLLSNQRCSKCGARLHCVGICTSRIDRPKIYTKEAEQTSNIHKDTIAYIQLLHLVGFEAALDIESSTTRYIES